MSEREILGSYLAAIESRLRIGAWARGLAVTAVIALAVTMALVVATNAAAFSPLSVLAARVVLFLALAGAVAAGIVLP